MGKALATIHVGMPVSGRYKKGKGRALIDRLIKYKDGVFRFISNLLVPFTNNLAEQIICMLKIKTKVSGYFRAVAGGVNYAAIMFYLHTAMKCDLSAYAAIRTALAGKSYAAIFTCADPD